MGRKRKMAELVLQSNTLPEPIYRLIRADRVRVRESSGEIHLVPITEETESRSILPILGMYTDGRLTVDGYLERKRVEKGLER